MILIGSKAVPYQGVVEDDPLKVYLSDLSVQDMSPDNVMSVVKDINKGEEDK